MKRPVFEVVIGDDDSTGIELISMVQSPAMEVQAVKLSKQISLAKDSHKQYLTSAIIVPDKLIFRKDGEQEYDIVFRVDQIEKMRNKFHESTGNLKLSNVDHTSETVKATLIESWIKTSEQDKSNALGFDLPVGTWLATYKIQDKNFWSNRVMTNEITGFSLEGLFNQVEVKMSTHNTEQELLTLLDEIITELEGKK